MFRSLNSRVASLALLLAAGFSQPAWELQHAASHHDAGHEVSEHRFMGSGSEPPIEFVAAPDVVQGHEHPSFQLQVRSPRDLTQAYVALPAATSEFRPGNVTVVHPTFALSPARASPTHDYPSQPRAPPLA